jgi:hypothetical protein
MRRRLSVMPIIGELVASRMPQHVRVNREGQSQLRTPDGYVRFWLLAELPFCTANVRFRGQSGHRLLQCKCPLMTQSGHRRLDCSDPAEERPAGICEQDGWTFPI